MSGLDSYLAAHRPIPSEASFADGQVLGEWRITAFLGKGGSAEVYQVENARTGALAAAKILMRDDAVARERFSREVAILARNDCSSFPRYFADGEIDGRPYLIAELLDQCPLPVAESEVERYVLAICRGVAHLHRRGLVHRDIKPSNVLQRANGDPVLIDFGLVKPVSEGALRRRDELSIVDGKMHGVGTPGYAAPEQFAGGDITPAADIHALGVLVEKILQGESASSERSRRYGRCDLAASSWRRIVRRATSSIPSERYQSVDEFVAAIRQRNRGRRIAICLLTLAMLAGGVALAWRLGRRLPEEVAWNRLCGEVVMTNVVRQELVEVKWMEMNGMKIPAERRHRQVTNRVEIVPVQLGGVTNVFKNPVRLKGGREYWVTGPGMLDGAFYAEGTKVTMRLKNCIVRNRASEPLGKVGVNYDLQDGAGLDLPGLDEPDDHGRHCIERNGSPTWLSFKKIDWEEPVIWKGEDGTGL